MAIIPRTNVQSIKFNLCSSCYRRNFDTYCREKIKFGESIIVINNSNSKCFVCEGFFSNILPSIISNIFDKLLNFGDHIKSIDIGTKLPYKFIENEDYIRSMFHIRGKSSIKTQINSDIRHIINSDSGIDIRYSEPDCKFEIAIDDSLQFAIFTIFKEHLYLGRYKKLIRGIPQRSHADDRNLQNEPDTRKCNSCIDSIELFIEEILTSDYNAEKIKIIWTGSEDKNSLVMGYGRPFLVKANTSFQKINTNKIYQRNGIKISFEDLQSDYINNWRTYRQVIDLFILIKREIDPNFDLESLIAGFIGDVRFMINKKLITKRIYKSKLMAVMPGNQFKIRLVLDNGVPIKQLIGGLDPIQPSLAGYLRVPCECIYFDIVDVFQIN